MDAAFWPSTHHHQLRINKLTKKEKFQFRWELEKRFVFCVADYFSINQRVYFIRFYPRVSFLLARKISACCLHCPTASTVHYSHRGESIISTCVRGMLYLSFQLTFIFTLLNTEMCQLSNGTHEAI